MSDHPTWFHWLVTWIDPRCWWLRGRLAIARLTLWRLRRENRRLKAERATMLYDLEERRGRVNELQRAIHLARDELEQGRALRRSEDKNRTSMRLSQAVAERRQQLGRPLTIDELNEVVEKLKGNP